MSAASREVWVVCMVVICSHTVGHGPSASQRLLRTDAADCARWVSSPDIELGRPTTRIVNCLSPPSHSAHPSLLSASSCRSSYSAVDDDDDDDRMNRFTIARCCSGDRRLVMDRLNRLTSMNSIKLKSGIIRVISLCILTHWFKSHDTFCSSCVHLFYVIVLHWFVITARPIVKLSPKRYNCLLYTSPSPRD